MTPLILTLNAGSSSIKFALYDAVPEPVERARGQIEGIGGDARIEAQAGGNRLAARDLPAVHDHDAALGRILGLIGEQFAGARIAAVGHRIVHGGPDHAAPIRLDAGLCADLARLIPFAPLHQPHNLAGVRAAMAAFDDAPQIGCFDTAFHRTIPWVNETFALPAEYFDRGVRRYGFHGLSYQFIVGALTQRDPALAAGRVVVAHLGNGASLCAMRGGRSVATSMGFSPLDGLCMGTRCGQIDPGVLLYMMAQEGLGSEAISDLLYRRSGLLGMSGLSNDMRVLEAADTPEARGAIAYFTARCVQGIAAQAATLGGLDAVVFTGGIGEHAGAVRLAICEGLRWLGLVPDPVRNAAAGGPDGRISASDSPVAALVIPTDEERVIARAAAAFLRKPA